MLSVHLTAASCCWVGWDYRLNLLNPPEYMSVAMVILHSGALCLPMPRFKINLPACTLETAWAQRWIGFTCVSTRQELYQCFFTVNSQSVALLESVFENTRWSKQEVLFVLLPTWIHLIGCIMEWHYGVPLCRFRVTLQHSCLIGTTAWCHVFHCVKRKAFVRKEETQ